MSLIFTFSRLHNTTQTLTNACTLTLMNARMQTLPLWAYSKTNVTNTFDVSKMFQLLCTINYLQIFIKIFRYFVLKVKIYFSFFVLQSPINIAHICILPYYLRYSYTIVMEDAQPYLWLATHCMHVKHQFPYMFCSRSCWPSTTIASIFFSPKFFNLSYQLITMLLIVASGDTIL